jgi:CopA family copper-resistance protein
MKTIVFLLLCLGWVNSTLAQHEHHGQPVKKESEQKESVSNHSPMSNRDSLSHRGMVTSLPASRVYALSRVKLTGKVVVYDLTIDRTRVNITGKPTWAMTLNGSVPGPTLTFTEGDSAVIRIHNKLTTETSVHWHGILLPNREDGVSYLNTPPIKAGQSHTFRFPLVQSGTYWFHSHTRYQEQRGVYGSIVIHPQKPKQTVDQQLVVVLSDWTNENPAYILKNLKRGYEWYSVKKGNAQSLNRIIAHKAVGAYLKQSFTRMPPMDISDVYYERFLINGKDTSRYPGLKPGQKLRLRVINASATTYFHLNFGGGKMELVAADGLDVKPVAVERVLIAVAETYDLIVTLPENGAYELRATAQDGSGYATAWLGKGKQVAAPAIPKPDLYQMTRSMSSMSMGSMGVMRYGKGGKGHSMSGMSGMNHQGMDMNGMDDMQMDGKQKKTIKTDSARSNPSDSHQGHPMNQKDTAGKGQGMQMPPAQSEMKHDGMDMGGMAMQGMNHENKDMPSAMNMLGEINTPDYNQLQAQEKTVFPTDRPIREIALELSGDMRRYIWGINGRTISQEEKILIRRGEIVRFRLTNGTMMLHPMHLHGHYFRVVNQHGDYSPLKHTVNVSPMQTVTIEFLADEEKDWFFHCHLLYHMLTGMARAVSYQGSEPDSDMVAIQKLHLRDMRDNQWFFWGRADVGFPTSYLATNLSNNRNAILIGGDANWNGRFEMDADYERYFSQYFRVFAGIDAGNEEFLRYVRDKEDIALADRRIIRPVAGIRYLLPFLIDSEVKVDMRGNVRFQLSGEQQLFPRVLLGWEAQWLVRSYTRLRVDVDYLLTKNVAFYGNYDTRYNTLSGGVSYRF